MSLTLRQQIIRDPEGRVKYRVFREGGKRHYHVGVWLDASLAELNQIKRVDYRLHPTFRKPDRYSENASNKFSITFWTYGTFLINATIHYKLGGEETKQHCLVFDLPPDEGNNYVQIVAGDPESSKYGGSAREDFTPD